MYNERNIAQQDYTGAKAPSTVHTEAETLLSKMVGELEKHNAQIGELTRDLNRLIDRLIGSEPQAPGKEEKGVELGRGIAHNLGGHLIMQEVLIGGLESAIMRLSVL